MYYAPLYMTDDTCIARLKFMKKKYLIEILNIQFFLWCIQIMIANKRTNDNDMSIW